MVDANSSEAEVTETLERLAADLGGRGLDTVITAIGGRPVLVTSNPRVPALSENVLMDGQWFWWSWAERIAPVADIGGTADAIARVLAAGNGLA
jgi:hypothetical protein